MRGDIYWILTTYILTNRQLVFVQMCVPHRAAAFLVAALMVLLRTNMDAKFVNVQVSALGSRKMTVSGSTHAQKEELRDKQLQDERRLNCCETE